MRPGPMARTGLRATERYRRSDLHDQLGCTCRFTPSCSHYADEALRQRAFAVALLLIGWRLLRCNRFTRMGTVDHVGPARISRAQIAGVLALSGLVTFLVAGTASAAATLAQGAGSSRTAGGCDAHVGGVPIGTLDSDHPLQVHKGQRIVLTGQAPAGIRNLPSSLGLRSTTNVKIHFIEKLATKTETHNATGQNFQRSVNVDTYLKYGSGVYRVDVHSVASGGWDCSATFYVELHGSKLAAEVAIAVGAVGAAGMAASARGGAEPDPDALPPKEDDQGLVDPTTPVEQYDKLQVQKDKAANAKADGGTACLAGILFALIASTGAFAFAVPAASSKPPAGGRRRVWVRGHPVLGFLSGLFAGLGATIALQQFGFYVLNLTSLVVAPLITAVLGGWRGWRGTAWRV